MRVSVATRAPATACRSRRSTFPSSRPASSCASGLMTGFDRLPMWWRCLRSGDFVKLVHWLVTLPLAIILVIFAVSNREGVIVTLWPLPVTVEAPLYLVVLLALVVGFLVGEVVAWINGRRWRASSMPYERSCRRAMPHAFPLPSVRAIDLECGAGILPAPCAVSAIRRSLPPSTSLHSSKPCGRCSARGARRRRGTITAYRCPAATTHRCC